MWTTRMIRWSMKCSGLIEDLLFQKRDLVTWAVELQTQNVSRVSSNNLKSSKIDTPRKRALWKESLGKRQLFRYRTYGKKQHRNGYRLSVFLIPIAVIEKMPFRHSLNGICTYYSDINTSWWAIFIVIIILLFCSLQSDTEFQTLLEEQHKAMQDYIGMEALVAIDPIPDSRMM